MNSLTQDKFGNKSSKRVAGISLISAGGLLIMALGVASFFIVAKDPATIITCGKTLIVTGAALLGIGVFEGIKDMVKK